MYTFGDNVPLGTTRTRTPISALDAEAMGTTDKNKLENLCRQGSSVACRYANMPETTAAQEAQYAANRDADAVAQRDATAKRLVDAGVNPRIAEAVRTGKDVIYAKDKEEAERIVREHYSPEMADEIMDDFFKLRAPWYHQTRTWVIAAVVATAAIAFFALRPTA